ncbi:Redoxin family [uncultured Alphaproteobacteria bacterium]|uniref:Redoxin family n=1 Tax=uncultured Alphaproteobacteria bacterium TaxID=91750 RepID=A0A212JFL7_9PROT|nr:Redoxin family [uncultured Alphaproteobacteria bacterium]
MLLIAAYLGGALTILSPCILPVLPFVFARAGKDFRRNGLPLLAGLAITFAIVGSLAAAGGAWAARGNEIGRWAALIFLALMGAALAFPAVATWIARPFVGLGERVSMAAGGGDGPGGAALTGVATGLVWAPCAGPILGLILGGAALQGGGAAPALAAYALGSVTSLGVALLAGGRIVNAVKRRIGIGEGVRRILGVLVLGGVAVAALGAETLARWSGPGTERLEQAILDRLPGAAPRRAAAHATPLATLDGATAWLNGPPLSAESLAGKVVLIDFWTYSCINCVRAIPHVRALDAKYRDKGLTIVGVHTPEFAFEKIEANVRDATREMGIRYPVALDNAYAIWGGFANRYWPAQYLLDGEGRVRYTHFGEGGEAETERAIRDLLAANGAADLGDTIADLDLEGAEMAADFANVKSPETYVGFERTAGFASPEGITRDQAVTYSAPPSLSLNQWALAGDWAMGPEDARLAKAGGAIAMRFHARDLHLVLGPGRNGMPVRFRVTVDGRAPGADAGVDVDAQGYGTVTEHRLYQLVRQKDGVRERSFAIEFLDPGVQAFAFTFG